MNSHPASFTNLSEELTLDPALVGCCSIYDQVVLISNMYQFRGSIECSNECCDKIKVYYDPLEAGYAPSYIIKDADIVSIRCWQCCDTNYYDIQDCVSPNLIGLPEEKPIGGIMLYAGSLNDPTCMYQYIGYGNHRDLANYISIGDVFVSSFVFDPDSYELTITMNDGTIHMVQLSRDAIGSVCFDSFPLDCTPFEAV